MTMPHSKITIKDGDYLLAREAAAILLNIEAQTLTKWQKMPDPPPYNELLRGYPARELGNWIRKRQTLRKGIGNSRPYLPEGVVIAETTGGMPSALPQGDQSNRKDFNEQRTRKEAALADKAEMDNMVTRGELILASEVQRGWSDILSRMKTRMMQVPYTCAMLVVGDNDMASVQSKIKETVRDALLELSTDWRDNEASGDDDI